MKKAMLTIAAAATIAVFTLGTLTPADAQRRNRNAAIGLGILGAAVVGGAIIANSYPRYYGPAPGYVVYDGYGAPAPYDCPGYWTRRPRYDGYGNVVGYSAPRWRCG